MSGWNRYNYTLSVRNVIHIGIRKQIKMYLREGKPSAMSVWSLIAWQILRLNLKFKYVPNRKRSQASHTPERKNQRVWEI